MLDDQDRQDLEDARQAAAATHGFGGSPEIGGGYAGGNSLAGGYDGGWSSGSTNAATGSTNYGGGPSYSGGGYGDPGQSGYQGSAGQAGTSLGGGSNYGGGLAGGSGNDRGYGGGYGDPGQSGYQGSAGQLGTSLGGGYGGSNLGGGVMGGANTQSMVGPSQMLGRTWGDVADPIAQQMSPNPLQQSTPNQMGGLGTMGQIAPQPGLSAPASFDPELGMPTDPLYDQRLTNIFRDSLIQNYIKSVGPMGLAPTGPMASRSLDVRNAFRPGGQARPIGGPYLGGQRLASQAYGPSAGLSSPAMTAGLPVGPAQPGLATPGSPPGRLPDLNPGYSTTADISGSASTDRLSGGLVVGDPRGQMVSAGGWGGGYSGTTGNPQLGSIKSDPLGGAGIAPGGQSTFAKPQPGAVYGQQSIFPGAGYDPTLAAGANLYSSLPSMAGLQPVSAADIQQRRAATLASAQPTFGQIIDRMAAKQPPGATYGQTGQIISKNNLGQPSGTSPAYPTGTVISKNDLGIPQETTITPTGSYAYRTPFQGSTIFKNNLGRPQPPGQTIAMNNLGQLQPPAQALPRSVQPQASSEPLDLTQAEYDRIYGKHEPAPEVTGRPVTTPARSTQQAPKTVSTTVPGPPTNINPPGEPMNLVSGGFFRNSVPARTDDPFAPFGNLQRLLARGAPRALPGLLEPGETAPLRRRKHQASRGGAPKDMPNRFGSGDKLFGGLQLYGGDAPAMGPFEWDLPPGLFGIEPWFRRQMARD